MRVKELRAMGAKEIDEKLLELKKELLKMRGQIAVGTVPKNPGQVKNLKKGIAQIMLVKQEKSTQPQGGSHVKA
jgi:large subunit ribosomal protein L29